MNEAQEQVIIGCVLGDGRLDKPLHGNSRLLVRHSIKQYMYLLHKHGVLAPYSLSIFVYDIIDKRSGRTYRAAGFNTIRSSYFTYLYRLCYPNDTKTVPHDLVEIANEIALAIFIGDDGTYDINSKTVKISVDAYSYESRIVIKRWLSERFGLEVTIEKDRIYVLRRSMPRLADLVKDYLPPSMHYKLGVTPYTRIRIASSTSI